MQRAPGYSEALQLVPVAAQNLGQHPRPPHQGHEVPRALRTPQGLRNTPLTPAHSLGLGTHITGTSLDNTGDEALSNATRTLVGCRQADESSAEKATGPG